MPNLANKPAAIVLPKSTNSASARFYAANHANRLFFSSTSLNRVNVRGPRVLHPKLSRGGDLGWVHGTAETNRPFVEYPTFDLAWQRGTTHKFAQQVGRGMAERGR
jgi:hypothetical protein